MYPRPGEAVESFYQQNPEIPKPETGGKVGEMVSEFYDRLPAVLGCHFVESNVVLTLAGMKGMTFFPAEVPDSHASAALRLEIEKLNGYFREKYPFLQAGVGKKTHNGQDGKKYCQIFLDNLKGYERASRLSRLPGIKAYDAETGFEGLGRWQGERGSALEVAQARGELPKNYSLTDIEAGMDFGYPDQAILDRVDQNVRYGGGMKDMQDSAIPFTGIHDEADPNFELYPRHAQDAQIKDYELQAGTVLRDFYFSAGYKRLAGDERFRSIRAEQDHEQTRS